MVKQIMIVGTASDVGKSVIVAGFCRIFKQMGYKTAPFKSQNIALNSFITTTGEEMGRAQVFQAEAAGILPDARMNPILLKLTMNQKPQVIFMGKVLGNMSGNHYDDLKVSLIPKIQNIHKELSQEFDAIVIEGAGSPAEINMNSVDIVNLGLAKMIDAPALLVADIDKGGVFASIYGTIMLLSEEERCRIKGVIINKFRGDLAILEPGIDKIEALTGIPVLGVIPYIPLQLESEDSVSLEQKSTQPNPEAWLDIAVIDLPHMSNFSDFDVLDIQEHVHVRYIRNVQDFGKPDVLIIPGTKSTIDDLAFLNKNGISNKIKEFAQQKGRVIGICGGFQILGQSLADPQKVESHVSKIQGLGLLDVTTEFEAKKITTQVKAKTKSGISLQGYEIHMGRTRLAQGVKHFSQIYEVNGVSDLKEDGAISKDGRIIGTYLHGVFDNLAFTKQLFDQLMIEKGEVGFPTSLIDLKAHKEAEYDKLATIIKENLNLEAVMKIMEGSNC